MILYRICIKSSVYITGYHKRGVFRFGLLPIKRQSYHCHVELVTCIIFFGVPICVYLTINNDPRRKIKSIVGKLFLVSV